MVTSGERWRKVAELEDALAHNLTESEFRHLKDVVGRDVTMLELGIASALYSEHCSYKSTKPLLKSLPTEGPRVLQGPGENAGVVDIGGGKAVVFKIESHNHPSFIEPYQGAATGVGGILRDVFTMGARPIALMNALRFGDLQLPRTRMLLRRAVEGIGGYGNSVGVPTVGGELFFHEAFSGNCLVNAFALGIIDSDKIFLGRAVGVGNSVLYVGSKTGRDGIRGANMASESFGDDSASKRPTVQVGDPFQEKLLIEACLAAMRTGAVVGIQDMGAAGLTSSTYEMAARAGSGVRLWLDRVPCREQAMNPYEIMLSESQERMLLIVEKGREREIERICEHYDLDSVAIGEVISGDSVHLMWHGEEVSVLPANAVTESVPLARWPEAPPSDYQERLQFDCRQLAAPANLADTWLTMLGHPNLCSRSPLYSQYDSTIRSNTVIHPGGDAAVVRVKSERKGGRERGIAMTLDCNSRFSALDPRHGTALSVIEAFRNITAVGAAPIGISDNLNFGSPQRPEGMWQIAEAIRGLGEAARTLSVPIVSGNVSLYNETKGRAILPSLVVAMVGLLEDVSLARGAHFRDRGDRVLLIGTTAETDLGGSEYMAVVHGVERGAPPPLNYELELTTARFIREIIAKRMVQSCHDLSSGGLAVALAESCVTPYERIGVSLRLESQAAIRPDALLFAESGARYLVSCSPNHEAAIRRFAGQLGLSIAASGTVGGDRIEVQGVVALDLAEAAERWLHGLDAIFNE